jgi:hypothetical protein
MRLKLTIFQKIFVVLRITWEFLLSVEFWTIYILNFIILHLNALVFWIIETPENNQLKSHWDSFYWSLSTAIGGGGRIEPLTEKGMALELLTMTYGVILVALFTGLFFDFLRENERFQKEFKGNR